MPTSYTSLIGLALPVTGELSGTWGDVVNNYITNYLDSAVAGTQTISGSQTAVTLSVTNGSSLVTAGSGATGSAQFQIINCTGNPAGLLTITAPASSRQYIVINATSTSQSVKIVGTGPTTGVTLIAGEKAHVAWNGSDFVKIATTAAAGGSNTQVQYNSSGVLAGSSNMTFDGTNLTVGGTASATKLIPTGGAITGNGMYLPAANSVAITTNGAQAIYINSSQNVGIGTSSPSYKLDVSGEIRATSHVRGTGSDQLYLIGGASNNNNNIYIGGSSAGTANTIAFTTNATEQMRLDSSGNLGLGVTPSAWGGSYKAIEFPGISVANLNGGTNQQAQYLLNAYDSGAGAWKYKITGVSAAMYRQSADGAHEWHRAPSGTAGNAISFTQAMTLDSSGNLGIGTTSPGGYRLAVVGTANITNGASQTFRTGMLIEGGGSASGDLSPALQFSSSNINAAIYSERLSSYGGNLIFATQGTSVGNPTERARIDYSGNLGLGATSITNCRFQIKGANNTTNAYADGVKATSNNETVSIQYSWAGINASSDLIFATGGTERSRITSDGHFLVGTTSSNETLANGFIVLGASGNKGYVAASMAGSTNAAGASYHLFSTGANAYRFYVGLGGTIFATSTTITGISDQRLKENIRDLDVGLDKIMALKPRKFDWKEGKGKNIKGDRGWIAQEFEQVFPDMIDTWKDPAPEGEEPYKSVRADLIPVLVKAIQEQQTIIQSLTARIAALESKGA